MFIVIASHNTRQGDATSPFFISTDPKQALSAARNAEKFGFRFLDDGSAVRIYLLAEDTKYTKEELRGFGGMYSVLQFVRTRTSRFGGEWNEDWNPRFKERAEEKTEDLFAKTE